MVQDIRILREEGEQRAGRLTGGNDLPIAAHAVSPGVTPVTSNVREFEHVGGLAIASWT